MKKSGWWIVYLLVVVCAFVLAFLPYRILNPNVAQTPDDLALVFNLKKWTVFAVPLLLLAGVFLLRMVWRKTANWPRFLAIPCLLPAVFATWLVFANPFEMMFSPLPKPEFAEIDEVDFMADEDMVLAVVINGDAVAYPLRQLGHHHIVQDVVGEVPIAVTY